MRRDRAAACQSCLRVASLPSAPLLRRSPFLPLASPPFRWVWNLLPWPPLLLAFLPLQIPVLLPCSRLLALSSFFLFVLVGSLVFFGASLLLFLPLFFPLLLLSYCCYFLAINVLLLLALLALLLFLILLLLMIVVNIVALLLFCY